MRNQSKIAALVFAALIGATAANAQTVRVPLPAPNSESQIFRMELPAQSYLGVQTENVSAENFGKYSMNEARGVAVTRVLENSPAARAGLREKDVILSFDGEPVKSVAKLLRLIEEVAPDQKAKLTIYRSGGEQELTVTMGKRPAPQGAERFGNFPPFPELRGNVPMMPPQSPQEFEGFGSPGAPNLYEDFLRQRGANSQAGRRLGVVVAPLTKQLGETYGAIDGKGLLVTEVSQDSAAAKAGLKAGDVILEVDGAAVSNRAELTAALNKNQEGEISITILRGKQRQTMRATPDGKKAAAPADNGTKFKI